MASSEVLAIERLAACDVAGGLALSDAAGWNQSADDWSIFIGAGAAFGLRDERAALVATAAALPYDSGTGWVSMVLVDAAHRHRGIASQLVDACVVSLRECGRTPVLDATPAGAAVYAKIGFVEGFAFERWKGEGAAAHAGAADAVVVAAAAHVETMIALDRTAGGVDRGLLWRAFLDRPSTSAWLTARSDGFALRRAGRRATQVGPIVAANDDDALALLAAALAGAAGGILIDVPVHRTALTADLARRGYTRQRSFVRMALGDVRAAAARADVFALAGPEFG
ncbi:MAG: GNAT family N-acetyltransferase [Caldimonas sp.]